MLVIVGAIIVVVSVLGGFVALGGHIDVLIQPFEFVIIVGAALGAFMIGNPKEVIIKAFKSVMQAIKGSPYNKQSYLELLSLLYALFKLGRSKGPLALEQHLENPQESELFTAYPKIIKNHHAVTFLTD